MSTSQATGDTAGYEAAVNVARFKAELGREGRPAFIGKGHILSGALVRFGPVEESQFVLCHAGQEVRPGIAVFAEFFGHIGDDVGNARIVFMGLIRYEEVQFRVFFDFNAQVIERLNRSVAGEEVLRTRSEGDDF